jgi:hypothetical protein
MHEPSTEETPDNVLDLRLKSPGTPEMVKILLRDLLAAHGLLDVFEEALDAFTELMELAHASGPVQVKIRVEFGEPGISLDMLGDVPELPTELRDRIEILTGGTWSRRYAVNGGHRVWAKIAGTRGRRPHTGRGSSPS